VKARRVAAPRRFEGIELLTLRESQPIVNVHGLKQAKHSASVTLRKRRLVLTRHSRIRGE